MVDFFVTENEQRTHIFSFVDQIVAEKLVFHFYVERNAQLIIEFLCIKSSIDIIVEIYLCGEGASASLQGAYVAHQTDKITMHTLQHHQASHTQSSLIIRGVLYDASYVSYNGTI